MRVEDSSQRGAYLDYRVMPSGTMVTLEADDGSSSVDFMITTETMEKLIAFSVEALRRVANSGDERAAEQYIEIVDDYGGSYKLRLTIDYVPTLSWRFESPYYPSVWVIHEPFKMREVIPYLRGRV